MAKNKISFYRQARADGGIRTGVSVNDTIVLGHFAEGKGDPQPYLKWFVDVRCEGNLPKTPEEARTWLIQNKAVIKGALNNLAASLRVGLDVDSTPVSEQTRDAKSGVLVTVACSATSRLTGREIAKALESTAVQWVKLLQALHELQAA